MCWKCQIWSKLLSRCYLVQYMLISFFSSCLQHGHDFPPNFDQIIKKIHRLLFHVISHIYHAHFREVGSSLGTSYTIDWVTCLYCISSWTWGICLACIHHQGPLKVSLVQRSLITVSGLVYSVVDPDPVGLASFWRIHFNQMYSQTRHFSLKFLYTVQNINIMTSMMLTKKIKQCE